MIGIGSLAAGSAAATGTGAFSAMSADRSANIDVVNDSAGLLSIVSDTPSDVVRQNDNGEIVIDFTADDNAGGINVNSRYQVGEFSHFPPGEVDALQDEAFGGWGNPYDDAAFYIQNNDSTEKEVELTYNVEGNIDGSQIYFQLQDEDDKNSNDITDEILIPNVAGRDNTAKATLSAGEKVGVSFQVDTGDGDPGFGSGTDGSTSEDLSGSMTVSAN
jgi:uncharacterized cupredoxin-like copper-binding protein